MWPTQRRSTSLVLLILVVLLAPGCSKAPKTPSTDLRILLLAVDGLEWDLVLPMAQEGRLPTMRRLMESGSFGLLETFEPTLSPAIWTSVATGKDRKSHGILKFQVKDREVKSEDHRRLYNSIDRKTKAFWNILSDYGRRVNTIGWFVTYPAEEINGVMVAQANTSSREKVQRGDGIHKPQLEKKVPGQVYPESRTAEVLSFLDRSDAELATLRDEVFGTFPHPLGPVETRFWKASDFSFRADSTYAMIARKIVGEGEFDLTAMYIGGTDTVAHRFWRYMRPDKYVNKPSPEQIANFGDVIRKYYTYADRVIGELMTQAGPDVTVIVISDHGMHEFNEDRTFSPEADLKDLKSGDHPDAPPGIIIASGPGFVQMKLNKPFDKLTRSDLQMVGDVYDITPTLLVLLNIPVGEDMLGEPLTNIIQPEWLARFPISTVPSHDTKAWLELQANRTVPAADSEEYRKQLRDLGYVDDDEQLDEADDAEDAAARDDETSHKSE